MRTRAGVFRQDDYDELNDLSIKKVSSYLERRGYLVPYKKEDYDIDIVAYKGDQEYRVEVEVRTKLTWTSENDFPFDTVSFLGRKKKYQDNKPFWYFLVSNDMKHFLYCSSDDIFKEEYRKVKKINTEKRFGTDSAYHVPKHKCHFRNINE